MWSITYFRKPAGEDSGTLHTLKVESGPRALEVSRQLLRSGHQIAAVTNDAGQVVLDAGDISDLFGDAHRSKEPT